MPRYDYKKLNYTHQEKLLKIFVSVLRRLGTEENIINFLKDILNRSERLMLTRRLLVGKLLVEGKTYDEIQKVLKVGRATIARVERWLNFGRGGLLKAVKSLDKILK